MNEFTATPELSPTAVEAQRPLQIGGWLIVIAVGLVIGFIQSLTGMVRSLSNLGGPVWARLTDPNSSVYHPYWRTVIIYEAITTCVYVVMGVISLALFFGHRRSFPVLAVIFIPSMFVMMLVNHYLAGQITFVAARPAHANYGQLLAVRFVAMHIWIPYLLVSKRVKATFIR